MKKRILSFALASTALLSSFALGACGGGEDPEHTHSWDSSWSYDATNHWKKCTINSCTETKDKSSHNLVDNVCKVCGYQGGASVDEPEVETVEKIHDLRIITEGDEYTLVILPDEKIVLIDPCFKSMSTVVDLSNMIPYTHDADGDGLVDIDYLILTNPWFLTSEGNGFDDMFEVLNYYRPNIGLDVGKLTFSDGGFTDNTFYYADYSCSEEDIASISESYLSGKELQYYTSARDIKTGTNEGVYYGEVPTQYVASLYFAEKMGIKTIPITDDASITNKFKHNGQIYSYSIDFLELDVVVNPEAYGENTKHYLMKDHVFTEEFYIWNTGWQQSAEYSHMFTIKYQDFTMLYLGSATHNMLKSFHNKYGDTVTADLMVSVFKSSNVNNLTSPYFWTWSKFDINVPSKIFDISDRESNYIFANAYGLTEDFEKFGKYFTSDDTMQVGGGNLVKSENYIISHREVTRIKMPCMRVNSDGEQTCEIWDNAFKLNSWEWDDWS